MKCASCAAPLEIKPEVTEFVCAYCGSAQIVDRSGGTVTLTLVAETLGKVQQNTDRTASELALVRLKKLRLNMAHGDYWHFEVHPPSPPVEKRPIVRSGWNQFWREVWAGGSSIAKNDWALTKLEETSARTGWEIYDQRMAEYKTALLNEPAVREHNKKVEDDYKKRLAVVDAEIAIHEAIVKRS